MGQGKLKQKPGTILVSQFRTTNGAVVVNLDGNLLVVPTTHKGNRKRAAAAVQRVMTKLHPVASLIDMGCMIASKLAETINGLRQCGDDAAERPRLLSETKRFALALPHFEGHPYVYVSYDSYELETGVRALREIADDVEFAAWQQDLIARALGEEVAARAILAPM